MSATLLNAIVETSYLNAQNVGRYRCIMRYFYEQHQRLRYWLKPREVFDGAVALGLLEEDYTLEQCQKDLNQLVEWRNLVPRHDGGRSATVEEYLRKKFRYQMTPYAVEIERLVAGLEKIRGYGGSLEPSLFEEIAANLDKLEKSAGQFPPGEAVSLWERIYADFTKLTENASDYIASLQSTKVEELMLTEAFLAYKDSVTQYLQDFIQGLQRHAYKTEALLTDINEGLVHTFLANVRRDLAARPQLDDPLTPAEQLDRLRQEWQSMVRWFAGYENEPSDVYFLEQTTKDTIARIVRSALRIQEKHRLGVSRRRELDYLGKWFFSLADIDDSHRLAAQVFGLYRCRHFQGLDDKDTDNPDISMWQAGPNIRALRSRSRKRLRDGGAGAIKNQSERQQRAKEDFLLARREESLLLQEYLARQAVRIADLDRVSPRERYYLLYWIGRCLANKSRRILTPEGIGITLTLPAGPARARLECDDGELDMPNYLLQFSAGTGVHHEQNI
ncbi:MAG: TIGR02677 family protein [Firmicutes bacterium]|nr:TIGR02677 family protein [Bacillota bacterium]